MAVVPGSVLFGLYHIAHSPPFNTLSMIVFLTSVGVLTGFFFLVIGDLWATILFHNFLALHGVLTALEQAPAAAHASEIRVGLVVLGILILLALAVIHGLLRGVARRQAARTSAQSSL